MARTRKAKPKKRSTRKRAGTKAPKKRAAKKTSTKKKSGAAKKTSTKKKSAAKKTSAGKRRAPARSRSTKQTTAKKKTSEPDPAGEKKSPAAAKLAKKRRANADETVPGGTAPKIDDVTRARRALREVRDIVEKASDAEAERILGGGDLEKLLTSVVPAPSRSTKSTHEHLTKHKRRASLLARLRHDINDQSAFPVDGGYISPTRVQWFYDGLTFLEGREPYRGVVGLYRDGVVSYGLSVVDAGKEDSLGPLASDFVAIDEAKKSFRGATGKANEALAEMLELATTREDDTEAWIDLLGRHPWMLGAQHASISRVERTDADLPRVVGKRANDGATDILLFEPASTPIVGKTGKVLASFRGVWARAEQLRTFVQRQASYLQRELKLKIREPRFLIIAGRGLDAEERASVRREMEAHHAAVRLVTYDELRRLAERTLAFFEPRL